MIRMPTHPPSLRATRFATRQQARRAFGQKPCTISGCAITTGPMGTCLATATARWSSSVPPVTSRRSLVPILLDAVTGASCLSGSRLTVCALWRTMRRRRWPIVATMVTGDGEDSMNDFPDMIDICACMHSRNKHTRRFGNATDGCTVVHRDDDGDRYVDVTPCGCSAFRLHTRYPVTPIAEPIGGSGRNGYASPAAVELLDAYRVEETWLPDTVDAVVTVPGCAPQTVKLTRDPVTGRHTNTEAITFVAESNAVIEGVEVVVGERRVTFTLSKT